MAVPKKKTSKTRTRTRRAHLSLKPVALSLCSHCHQSCLPHTVCPNCGYYKNEEIIKMETKIKRKNKVIERPKTRA